LIWTADGSVYKTTESCVHTNSAKLCITKREGTAPKSNLYDILYCSGGKLIQFLDSFYAQNSMVDNSLKRKNSCYIPAHQDLNFLLGEGNDQSNY
jgi:hypothetical protein